MKIVVYAEAALEALRRHRSERPRIEAKVMRYAETGAGDVTQLVGSPYRRLRVGDFRIVFAETDEKITVIKLGPRGSIYD